MTTRVLPSEPKLEQHLYGKVWQTFDTATYDDLVANVDRRGLDQKIIRYQGKILDGWHRYLACIATKVAPKFEDFTGSDLEAAELVHASGIRRQLSADQRYASFLGLEEACLAFKEKYEQLAHEGKERQIAGRALSTGDQRVDVLATKAEAAGVSKATAAKVEKVEKHKPKAVKDIAAGKTTANKELKKLPKNEKKMKAKPVRKPNEGDLKVGDFVWRVYCGVIRQEIIKVVAKKTYMLSSPPSRIPKDQQKWPTVTCNHAIFLNEKAAIEHVKDQWRKEIKHHEEKIAELRKCLKEGPEIKYYDNT